MTTRETYRDKIAVLRTKYGDEETDRLLIITSCNIAIDRLLGMNLLYDDALAFMQMYVSELDLLDSKRLLNDTRF